QCPPHLFLTATSPPHHDPLSLHDALPISGLARKGADAPIYHTDNPEQALASVALISGDALFLLKDFARYLEQDRILRRMRELGEGFRNARRSIVLSGASLKLPAELDDEVVP